MQNYITVWISSQVRRVSSVVLVMLAFSAFGGEVAQDEAREAARGWAALQEALTGKERFAGAEIADVKSYEGRDGRGSFHVVSFEGGGFAVTSGDTEIAPILAYSEEGEFVAGGAEVAVRVTRNIGGESKTSSPVTVTVVTV